VSQESEAILVVEDGADVRSYLVETLRDLNYRVRGASDGSQALALFDTDPLRVDLLLTDIVMPGMNGRQLADELRRRQPELKVLFMTGYSRDAVVHQGRLDSGVSLLQKPLNQSTLAAKIRDSLDQR
jgi:CheY-like chemotaxis protein